MSAVDEKPGAFHKTGEAPEPLNLFKAFLNGFFRDRKSLLPQAVQGFQRYSGVDSLVAAGERKVQVLLFPVVYGLSFPALLNLPDAHIVYLMEGTALLTGCFR